MPTKLLASIWLAVACGCASSTAQAPQPHVASQPAPIPGEPEARIRVIHGGAGPWVVAGYKMGAYALRVLGLDAGSFDMDVVHYSPAEVQYACIADGAAAATGASLGKLNLNRIDVPAPDTRTIYRSKATGKSVALRVTASFAERYTDVPRAELGGRGREVLNLPDDQVFEVVP